MSAHSDVSKETEWELFGGGFVESGRNVSGGIRVDTRVYSRFLTAARINFNRYSLEELTVILSGRIDLPEVFLYRSGRTSYDRLGF